MYIWCPMSIKLCLGFKDIYTLKKDKKDLNVSFGTNILCNWNIRKLNVHNFRLRLHSFMSSVKNRIKKFTTFFEWTVIKQLSNLFLVYKFLYFNIFYWFIVIIFFLLSCFPLLLCIILCYIIYYILKGIMYINVYSMLCMWPCVCLSLLLGWFLSPRVVPMVEP